MSISVTKATEGLLDALRMAPKLEVEQALFMVGDMANDLTINAADRATARELYHFLFQQKEKY